MKICLLFIPETERITKDDVHTMILATAATQFELISLTDQLKECPFVSFLVTGVGQVETTLNVVSHLCDLDELPDLIVNFGIGGAYLKENGGGGSGLSILDICIAESEVFGDMGVDMGEEIIELGENVAPETFFTLETSLVLRACEILEREGISSSTGNFVTVNSATGTEKRGRMLQKKHAGLCENMEGAALARICSKMHIPLLEVRCISNMVEDRDVSTWKTKEAAERAAVAVLHIIKKMVQK